MDWSEEKIKQAQAECIRETDISGLTTALDKIKKEIHQLELKLEKYEPGYIRRRAGSEKQEDINDARNYSRAFIEKQWQLIKQAEVQVEIAEAEYDKVAKRERLTQLQLYKLKTKNSEDPALRYEEEEQRLFAGKLYITGKRLFREYTAARFEVIERRKAYKELLRNNNPLFTFEDL